MILIVAGTVVNMVHVIRYMVEMVDTIKDTPVVDQQYIQIGLIDIKRKTISYTQ